MKVLYLAYRHDPTDPDQASGLDYQCYQAMVEHGLTVRVVGPFRQSEALPEKIIHRMNNWVSGKRYAKFAISISAHISRRLTLEEDSWKPDVIFTLFPAAMTFYRGSTPSVFLIDTNFIGQQSQWPLYSRLGMAISVWQERRAYKKANYIITSSEWSKAIFMEYYGLPSEQVVCIPMPSALPPQVIPPFLDIPTEKKVELPVRLLVVGRIYERKGIDIALEIVQQLNQEGTPAELVICGMQGQDAPGIRFVGNYVKKDPEQLNAYVNWYRWAHFLIHPARFDASPTVTSEAAAFGTPTISNEVGGIATSVKHGVSGILLPRLSPAAAYVDAIKELLNHPEQYYELCASTRRRYEAELNWHAGGRKLVEVLERTVDESHYK